MSKPVIITHYGNPLGIAEEGLFIIISTESTQIIRAIIVCNNLISVLLTSLCVHAHMVQ